MANRFTIHEKGPDPDWRDRDLRKLSLALQLFGFEVFGRGAADRALIGRLDALHLLAADGADHAYGHRRMRGFAVFGLYLLAGVAGELGDGDLAGDHVLHRVARPHQGVLDEREVYVRHTPLARQLLGHVARDVPHEALGRPLQAFDRLLGPGELPGAAFGDEVAGSREGGVVDRALASRLLLDLVLGVADGAAALGLRGLAACLFAVLLLDVLAGDGGIA